MIETISACKRRISDTIPAHEVESTIKKIVGKDAQSKRVKGFRPGSKQTLDFLYKQFTDYPEVAYSHFSTMLQGHDLKPVATPELKKVEKMSDGALSYIAEFEINPPISNVNWEQNIVLESLNIQFPAEDTVTEADVEELIANMTPIIEHANQKNSDSQTALPDKTKMYQELQEGITRNVKAVEKEHLAKQAIETLLIQNPLPELPESIVQAHYQSFKKQQNIDEDAKIDQELLEKARRKVKIDILIEAYRKQHNIELDQNKFKAKLELLNQLMIQEVQAGKSSQSDLNRILKNKSFMYNLLNEVLEEQIVEHLIQSAQSQPKAITYSKAIGLKDTLKSAFAKEIEKFAKMKDTIKQEEAAS